MRTILFLIALLLGTAATHAAERAAAYLGKPEAWFQSDEGKEIIKNIIAWQTPEGSWPKNTATTIPPKSAPQKGTFDNGATIDELRLLARSLSATKDSASKEAFLKGLDLILRAQYPNGGWPQTYPPGNSYARHITFNDGSMVRLMNFVRDVATKSDFSFVDSERRDRCSSAFERGVQCIVKSQIRVNGALTAWCAQHDENTFEPRSARTYELVSLSGAESAGILNLLMSIEKPSPEVIAAVDAAVDAAVAWFDSVQLKGIRETRVDGDKRIVPDPDAPPLWARFYEIGSNRPIFVGRDGVKKYDISEIESERRNGYAWYGRWGQALPKRHAAWKKRLTQSPAPK
jgi:PelA/Pel-15E family pectate lyase